MWTPKPHQPWFWSIIKQENPKLREGRWWIGKCYDVLLRHQDWFKSPNSVADLIDQNTNNWKPDLIWATYPYPQWSEILKIPLSKTSSVSDKLLWKHSNNGEFKVKNAYNLLFEDSYSPSPNQSRHTHIQTGVWKLISKIKVPLKICNFVWKLMHDSLPTFLTLKNRGISTHSSCPLCNTGWIHIKSFFALSFC